MFLPSKDGIICDICGITYKDEFAYYSTRTVKYEMVQNRRSVPEDAKFYQDFCSTCYEKLIDGVKEHLGKHRKDKIKCDLSNTYKSGTFTYYIMYFDKIDVNKSRGEGNETEIEKNMMDINIIEGFDKLLKQIQVVRKKIETQGAWT